MLWIQSPREGSLAGRVVEGSPGLRLRTGLLLLLCYSFFSFFFLIPVPVFREDFRNNEGEKMRYKLLHRNSATEQVKNSLLAVTGSRLESYRVQAIRFS